MARHAKAVVGLDVSPGMLAEAQVHAPANVDFVSELPAGEFDWINSLIVFQHIRPETGYSIFEEHLRRLPLGGVISHHFTIFRDARMVPATSAMIGNAAWDGSRMSIFRELEPPPGTMLMFDYDLTRLVAIVVSHGLTSVFLEHTDHGGCHEVRFFGRRDQ